MRQILICAGIFLSLAASRFIPHPPNFTSLLALAFYVPVFFGVRYIVVLIISFAITDLIIGYHLGTHWTWGSVLIIGLISKFFAKNHIWRISGALVGACIFFIVTNLGVWLTGVYGLSIPGLVFSYTIAIPFFAYSILSTLCFSAIIEIGYKILSNKYKFKKA
tara:strand:+ start:411 stop:899 length:489 start_codon:yes stop_codon:yes gene_type:complete